MKPLNVLVLGVGGNVSQGIMTALRHSKYPCNVIGACISEESLGLYFADKSYISPYANKPEFVNWVSDICRREKIDIVLSGVEENIVALEKERDRLEELGIPFFNTSIDFLKIGNDKLATSRWLKEKGLNFPHFAESDNPDEVSKLVKEVGFPLIAKPIKGKGSQGILRIKNEKDLATVPTEGYILQEELGTSDSEYTVGCYLDKEGQLSGMIIMQRWLKHGTTFKAKIVQDEEIRKECERICEKFPARGPLNIQLRKHKGQPVCFELNVRFSGTTPLRANWGFNDVEAFIGEYLFNETPMLNPDKDGVAFRYYNEAYVTPEAISAIKERGNVDNMQSYHNRKESL